MGKSHFLRLLWNWIYFVEVSSEKLPYVYEAPAGAFTSAKLTFLEISDMPILENMCISLYFGIFGLTATAAAASQQLCPSGEAPGPSRAGSKYPVRESLTSTMLSEASLFTPRNCNFPAKHMCSVIPLYLEFPCVAKAYPQNINKLVLTPVSLPLLCATLAVVFVSACPALPRCKETYTHHA